MKLFLCGLVVFLGGCQKSRDTLEIRTEVRRVEEAEWVRLGVKDAIGGGFSMGEYFIVEEDDGTCVVVWKIDHPGDPKKILEREVHPDVAAKIEEMVLFKGGSESVIFPR